MRSPRPSRLVNLSRTVQYKSTACSAAMVALVAVGSVKPRAISAAANVAALRLSESSLPSVLLRHSFVICVSILGVHHELKRSSPHARSARRSGVVRRQRPAFVFGSRQCPGTPVIRPRVSPELLRSKLGSQIPVEMVVACFPGRQGSARIGTAAAFRKVLRAREIILHERSQTLEVGRPAGVAIGRRFKRLQQLAQRVAPTRRLHRGHDRLPAPRARFNQFPEGSHLTLACLPALQAHAIRKSAECREKGERHGGLKAQCAGACDYLVIPGGARSPVGASWPVLASTLGGWACATGGAPTCKGEARPLMKHRRAFALGALFTGCPAGWTRARQSGYGIDDGPESRRALRRRGRPHGR